MKKTLIASILLFAYLQVIGGMVPTIYFCQSITSNGEPYSVSQKWNVPEGKSICVLYRQVQGLKNATLTLRIQSKGSKKSIAEKIRCNKQNWFSYYFIPHDGGTYNVSVMDAKKHVLASSVLSVTMIQKKETKKRVEKIEK